MNLEAASFSFRSKRLGVVCVVFFAASDARPTYVKVTIGNRVEEFDNGRNAYKPCVTHCLSLIKRVEFEDQKKAADEFEAQRRAKTPRANGKRVAVKVHAGGVRV